MDNKRNMNHFCIYIHTYMNNVTYKYTSIKLCYSSICLCPIAAVSPCLHHYFSTPQALATTCSCSFRSTTLYIVCGEVRDLVGWLMLALYTLLFFVFFNVLFFFFLISVYFSLSKFVAFQCAVMSRWRVALMHDATAAALVSCMPMHTHTHTHLEACKWTESNANSAIHVCVCLCKLHVLFCQVKMSSGCSIPFFPVSLMH